VKNRPFGLSYTLIPFLYFGAGALCLEINYAFSPLPGRGKDKGFFLQRNFLFFQLRKFACLISERRTVGAIQERKHIWRKTNLFNPDQGGDSAGFINNLQIFGDGSSPKKSRG
jgi:hypothetical protein